jgi:hypothetical protein
VALLDRQQHLANDEVAPAVAAAQDDPTRLGAGDQQAAELPQAGPLGGLGLPLAPPAGVQPPDEQADQEHWPPHDEDQGGVHAHRAGQHPAHRAGPGLGRVVEVAGQVPQDAGHVLGGHGQGVVGAEQDRGDLADRPRQQAGGEQHGAEGEPDRVGGGVLGVRLAIITPHPRHPQPRTPSWRSRSR